MTWVKVCGVRSLADVRACVSAGVDAIGVNFAPKSRRRVTVEEASAFLADARAETDADGFPVVVAVFQDQRAGDISRIAKAIGADAAQLHGDEPPGFCAALGPFDVWKALSADAVTAETLQTYAMWCDRLLVDGREPGSGSAWAWERIAPLVDAEGSFDGVPLALAGGLNPENVARAAASAGVRGVDVASGVEVDGAIDAARVAAFVAAARAV